jgi:uncharacterized membrane-anchored protein YhcB (DUF1043 family)
MTDSICNSITIPHIKKFEVFYNIIVSLMYSEKSKLLLEYSNSILSNQNKNIIDIALLNILYNNYNNLYTHLATDYTNFSDLDKIFEKIKLTKGVYDYFISKQIEYAFIIPNFIGYLGKNNITFEFIDNKLYHSIIANINIDYSMFRAEKYRLTDANPNIKDSKNSKNSKNSKDNKDNKDNKKKIINTVNVDTLNIDYICINIWKDIQKEDIYLNHVIKPQYIVEFNGKDKENDKDREKEKNRLIEKLQTDAPIISELNFDYNSKFLISSCFFSNYNITQYKSRHIIVGFICSNKPYIYLGLPHKKCIPFEFEWRGEFTLAINEKDCSRIENDTKDATEKTHLCYSSKNGFKTLVYVKETSANNIDKNMFIKRELNFLEKKNIELEKKIHEKNIELEKKIHESINENNRNKHKYKKELNNYKEELNNYKEEIDILAKDLEKCNKFNTLDDYNTYTNFINSLNVYIEERLLKKLVKKKISDFDSKLLDDILKDMSNVNKITCINIIDLYLGDIYECIKLCNTDRFYIIDKFKETIDFYRYMASVAIYAYNYTKLTSIKVPEGHIKHTNSIPAIV